MKIFSYIYAILVMYILKNIETYEVNICLPDQNNKKRKVASVRSYSYS